MMGGSIGQGFPEYGQMFRLGSAWNGQQNCYMDQQNHYQRDTNKQSGVAERDQQVTVSRDRLQVLEQEIAEMRSRLERNQAEKN